MKECLRLVPPVPVVARRTVKDTEVLGVRVPADRLVAVMLHLGHHMPELWPDPERFDPERFAAAPPRGQGATGTPGSRSAAGCTSASGCPSPAPR